MDYGIYTTQGKKVLLGNRATVNGRDAIAYVKNGRLQSYAYMDDFASQFYSGPRMNFTDSSEEMYALSDFLIMVFVMVSEAVT